MAKIKGDFAPLTRELGDDDRFLLQLNDLEKLIYILIIYTCHMTRHQAPSDPQYYIKRFNLNHRLTAVRQALDKCLVVYPLLKCNNKKLSLINSATYKSQISTEIEEEREVEVETDTSGTSTPPKASTTTPGACTAMDEGSAANGFNEFWARYPKKKSKGDAERAWKKIKPNEQLQGKILSSLELAKTSVDWEKEMGRYIPYPASWLNAKGWEDEHEQPKKKPDPWKALHPNQFLNTKSLSTKDITNV